MRKEQVTIMADNKGKAQYAKPASQVDLEARLASGNRSRAVLSTADSYEGAESTEGREFAVEGNDTTGYIGVSPEYATYASETEAPILPDEESAEDKVAEAFAEDIAPLAQMRGEVSEGQESASDPDPEDDGDGEKSEAPEESSTTSESTAKAQPAKSTSPTKKTASSSNS